MDRALIRAHCKNFLTVKPLFTDFPLLLQRLVGLREAMPKALTVNNKLIGSSGDTSGELRAEKNCTADSKSPGATFRQGNSKWTHKEAEMTENAKSSNTRNSRTMAIKLTKVNRIDTNETHRK